MYIYIYIYNHIDEKDEIMKKMLCSSDVFNYVDFSQTF